MCELGHGCRYASCLKFVRMGTRHRGQGDDNAVTGRSDSLRSLDEEEASGNIRRALVFFFFCPRARVPVSTQL